MKKRVHSFEALIDYSQTHEIPEEYGIYLIISLLCDYNIPFRLFRVHGEFQAQGLPINQMAMANLLKVDDRLWLLSNLNKQKHPTLELFDMQRFSAFACQCFEAKNPGVEYAFFPILEEESSQELEFYKTVGKTLNEKMSSHIDWKVAFEKEMLNQVVPSVQTHQKFSPRI